MIPHLVLVCMVYACVYLEHLMSLAWVFSRFNNGFSLAFPFLDIHDVMGIILG